MKKFLLFVILTATINESFGQLVNICPTGAKRNNGNSCQSTVTNPLGGKLTVDFSAPPPSNLQIFSVIAGPTTSTVIPGSKQVANGSGNALSWCFEQDNMGSFATATYSFNFYFDSAPFNVYNGEQLFLSCSNATLPVTLGSFEAAQKSGKVTLTWNTLMELNNDGFEIERRIGTGAYQKIAFVDSKAPGGNGDAFSYSFEDNTLLPKGVTYYRLKQIDFDGRASYSEIRAVRSANGTLLLSVYPNPSRGTTNVAIPAGTGMVDVTLTDFTGKSLQQWTGLNTSNLQLTNLKPGMYTLRVSVRATGETITERIAVQ